MQTSTQVKAPSLTIEYGLQLKLTVLQIYQIDIIDLVELSGGTDFKDGQFENNFLSKFKSK